MRTLVDIPDEDLVLLNKLSKNRRQSRAHIVRTAISSYLHSQSNDLADSAFGLWTAGNKPRKFEDGVAYQNRMRREW